MDEKEAREKKAAEEGTPRPAGRAPHEGHHPGCRCEESTRKTLPEILKAMVRDLAFWKKEGRGD
ncbi:MAG: hypothetical protein Kow0025_12230 [Thermodesulfovibrionales bacterium]